MGVGSILLEHLAAAARENDIERFSAEVLPENRKMLTVFAEAGYAVKRHFDEGVVMLEFSIDPTEKSRAVMEAREHRAEAKSLGGLLAPRSVAVIGASREWGSIGYSLLNNLIEGGFSGPSTGSTRRPSNSAAWSATAPCAKSPAPVDLAVIAVPQEQVHGVIEECALAGVKGLLVVTGGFGKTARRAWRASANWCAWPAANGMRVIGPASLGLVNTDPAIQLNASVAPGMPKRGSPGPVQPVGAPSACCCTRRPRAARWASPPSSRRATGRTSPATTPCSSGRTTPGPTPWACTWNPSATRASSPASPAGSRIPSR